MVSGKMREHYRTAPAGTVALREPRENIAELVEKVLLARVCVGLYGGLFPIPGRPTEGFQREISHRFPGLLKSRFLEPVYPFQAEELVGYDHNNRQADSPVASDREERGRFHIHRQDSLPLVIQDLGFRFPVGSIGAPDLSLVDTGIASGECLVEGSEKIRRRAGLLFVAWVMPGSSFLRKGAMGKDNVAYADVGLKGPAPADGDDVAHTESDELFQNENGLRCPDHRTGQGHGDVVHDTRKDAHEEYFMRLLWGLGEAATE